MSMEEEKGTSLYVELDDIIHSTDLDEVSAESSNTFDNLPDGYYLTEVVESKLTRSKSSDKPMVTLRLAVVGNGYNLSEDGTNFEPIENVAKRNLWKHYVIKDGNSFKRFVSDMLKFEGETPNEPMLPKEAWTDSTTLEASVGVLSQVNARIYVHLETRKNNSTGESSQWISLESFKRAEALGLPVD